MLMEHVIVYGFDPSKGSSEAKEMIQEKFSKLFGNDVSSDIGT